MRRLTQQCFVYPGLLHLKIAKKRWQRGLDIALIGFGALACLFCSTQTCGVPSHEPR